MKKSYVYYPLFLGVFFALGIWLGSVLNENAIGNDYVFSNSSAKKRKLNRSIDLIDQRYVDKINTDSIVDATVKEFMQNIDQHSVYISSH